MVKVRKLFERRRTTSTRRLLKLTFALPSLHLRVRCLQSMHRVIAGGTAEPFSPFFFSWPCLALPFPGLVWSEESEESGRGRFEGSIYLSGGSVDGI